MNTKIIIASIIVAIVLAALSFVANLYALFPPPLAIFVFALLGGCFTSFWVCKAEGLTLEDNSQPSRKRQSSGKKKKAQKAAKQSSQPTSQDKETGSVKWFSASKGFGFITRDNGEDIFVHFRSIMGKGHRILREGQRVEFAVTEGTKGLQAEDVSAIKG